MDKRKKVTIDDLLNQDNVYGVLRCVEEDIYPDIDLLAIWSVKGDALRWSANGVPRSTIIGMLEQVKYAMLSGEEPEDG